MSLTLGSKWNRAIRFSAFVLLTGFVFAVPASGQSYNPADVAGYRYIPRTIYVKEPVTLEKWVEETQYETREIKETHPVTEIEKRERRTVVKKPVTRTTMREERTVVQKPITETRYRERTVEETSYDLVTEMRDERYTVEKPVIETQYRDERYTVRQKITEDMIEVQNQTVYRPQTSTHTALMPTQVTTQSTDLHGRPHLQWLQPGYYVDPATQNSVWRRRGLHWVQPNQYSTVTGFIPTSVEQTTLVPETIQTRRPVEISRYEDRVETRRVPYDVQRTISQTVTRQVPVTVKKPVVKQYVERTPYTETRYVDVEEIKQVPVTETVYEEVVEIEPYEVEVNRWKEITRVEEVPKQVRRRVTYQEEREVAKTIMVKVPVDRHGNHLSLGEPVSEEEMRASNRHVQGYGSTTEQPSSRYEGGWNSGSSSTDSKRAPQSVLVDESREPDAANPGMNMGSVRSGGSVPDADKAPTLANDTSSRGGLDRIEVRRESGLDTDIRPAHRPESSPNHQRDVLSTER